MIAASGLACLASSAPVIAAAPDARPCFTRFGSYALAPNSGAIIRIDPDENDEPGPAVIVFRPRAPQGWASQRLLMRFDLQLDEHAGRITNTGAPCKERR